MKNIYFIFRSIISIATFMAMALSMPASASLVDGLVTYYDFNGNANDQSGNANDGTVMGATLTTDRFGNANSAYSFNGVNNYILASADVLPTAERTVALWFKADAVTTQPVFLGYGGGGPTRGSSWFMGLSTGPAIDDNVYYVSSHFNVNTLTANYTEPPVGDWYHLAASTDVQGTRIYVNGVEVASNDNFVTNTFVTGRDLAIGVATSAAGFAPYTDFNVGYFDGVLDDVRIYDRALLDSEIRQLSGVPIPASVWLFGSGLLGLVGIARRKKAA